MNYLTVLLVSVALGIDAFSVSISIGLTGVKRREMYLVSGVVTIFHIIMPLIGLSLGSYLGKIAGPMASAVGAIVLISIGSSTIWKSIKEMREDKKNAHSSGVKTDKFIDISNPVSLILMAASVSLDALTVGFGLGTLKVDLYLTVLTMGVVAGIMTVIGLISGKKLSHAFGEWAEILGGLILVAIGLKFILF